MIFYLDRNARKKARVDKRMAGTIISLGYI